MLYIISFNKETHGNSYKSIPYTKIVDIGKDQFFESGVIRDLWMEGAFDEHGNHGVASQSLYLKTGFSVSDFAKMVPFDIDDVYTYQKKWRPFPVNSWAYGAMYHGSKFYDVAYEMLKHIHKPTSLLVRPTYNIFSNFFMMDADLWDEYMCEWFMPAIDYFEKNIQPCKYVSKFNPRTPEQLIKLTGLPYYTYAPFVLERLIGSFITHNNLTVYKAHKN